MNQLISQLESKSESSAHKIIKQLMYKYILKYNSNIVEAFLEKGFGERRADVYFKFKSGKKLVVEVQNSYITPKEINKRTRDYNNKGIYVLWVLYGHGSVVDSPKNPEHKKNVKITPAENRLHRLYGGRVYYVNLYSKKKKSMVTRPYALHFSNSDTIAPILFRKDYDSFLVRNVNFSFIPNWGVMFKTLNSYKIDRFYDKNQKYLLSNKIKGIAKRFNVFTNMKFEKKRHTKKFFKQVYNLFNDEYGKLFFLESLLQLITHEKLLLNKEYLVKCKNKLEKKTKRKFK